MFNLISDPSSQKLGIEIHKFTTYGYDHGFLQGSMDHDSTSGLFNLFASPNYGFMSGIASKRSDLSLDLEFDKCRTHSIHLGGFETPEEAECTIVSLESHYRVILKERGARRRRLLEKENRLELALEETADDTRYGEAIIQAINKRVFAMLDTDGDVNHRNVIGKIIPAYIRALGFKEYYVSHDLSQDGFGKVRFVLEGYYAFDFYEPIEKGRAPYLERYNCHRGNYVLSASSELTSSSLKSHVLSFMEGLSRDLGLFEEEDAKTAAQEAAFLSRRFEFIALGNNQEKPKILGLTAPLENTVLPFRQRLS